MTSNLTRRRVLTGLAATSTIAAVGAPAIAQGGPITLGVMVPETPAVAYIAAQMRMGIATAVDEINGAGGIFGKMVRTVERDSDTRPPILPGLCEDLVSNESAVALVGPFASAGRRWAAKPAAALDVPLLFASNHEGTFCGSHLFNFGTSTHQDVMPLIDHIDGGSGRKYFLVGSYPSWQHHMFRQCRLRIGKYDGKVYGQGLMDTGETDYDGVVRWLADTPAEVVLFCVPRSTGRHFMHSLRDHGMLDKLTIGWVGFNEAQASNLSDAENARIVTTAPFVASDDRPGVQDFVARFKAVNGNAKPVTYYAYTHYNAIMGLHAAWMKAGEASPAAALSALPGLGFDTPTGPLTIDAASHHATRDIVVAEGRKLSVVKRLSAVAPEAGCA